MKLRSAILATIISGLAYYLCLYVFLASGGLDLVDFCIGKEMKVTQAQVEQRINLELPKRATKSEVAAFVDVLTLNNLKFTHYDYYEREIASTSMDAPDVPLPNVAGYFVANIPEAGYDGLWMT